MQMTAARVLLQTQARAAAAFGWPDCSNLFDNADERARHVFATGAEKVLETAQRANEAVTELQRQVGRVVETQASAATEQWQRGIEELGSQTQQGIVQLCEAARQTAEEATQSLSEAANETRRQGEQVLHEAQANADERAKRNKAA
jgi:dsDNA-specific endonuclease/ATPase MutS2